MVASFGLLIKAAYLYRPEQPALGYVKGAVLC